MAARLRFLFLYYLLWVLLFQVARVLFLVYHSAAAGQVPGGVLALVHVHGLRMDLSMAAYLLILPCLLAVLSVWIPFFRRPLVYTLYTAIVLLPVLLLLASDLEVFGQWGFRMDATPLKYLAAPREAWASVSHLPIFWMALLLAAAFAGLLFLFRRLIRRRTGTAFAGGRWQQKALSTVVLLAVTAALLLPIRGGFQLAPLNQSSVYFSRYHFANQAAVNACWNFMHSLLNKGASNTNPYSYFEDTVARRVADSLYRPGPGSLPQLLRTRRPNVVLVIWESFTAKAVDSTWKGKEVTPYFNALKKEGIYFSNVFASGDRTDKGLTAILSGYPALPNGSIIHVPAKSGRLHNLGRLLKDSGYAASFYYGGAPEFGNFKSYFLQNGFDPIITEEDFSGKDRNSKWGAHDGVVAGRIIRDLATARTPFFTGWLTLSSHEPFEIPEAPLFPGSELADRFYSSLHYTDKALQQLVRYCARQPWWNETVMIIIADHGHPQPPREDRAENFRIPMLWLGGALTQRGLTVDRILSQVDFATTFTRQLGYPEGLFPYSRNAFDRTAQPWAFFSFNNGFGFQQPGSTLLYDHVGKTVIRSSGNAGAAQVRAGQALQQVFFRDYLQK